MHAGKDLIVSPLQFPGELALTVEITCAKSHQGVFLLSLKDVSVGTSILADDGSYPLPDYLRTSACPDFPLSSLRNSAIV